jgi:hypothetical protein
MTWVCIPSTYSAVREVDSLPTPSLDTLQLLLAKSKTIPEEFCFSGSLTEFYRCFPFGTISGRSEGTTQNAGKPLSSGIQSETTSSSRADFHARTFQPQEREQASRAQGPDEQRTGERQDFVFLLPPQETSQGEACDLRDMRGRISTKEDEAGEALRLFELQQGTRQEISRVAVGIKNRVDRLKAIGNGQVPAVAALAWRVLGGPVI